jgi:hypothetical protein
VAQDQTQSCININQRGRTRCLGLLPGVFGMSLRRPQMLLRLAVWFGTGHVAISFGCHALPLLVCSSPEALARLLIAHRGEDYAREWTKRLMNTARH